MGEYIVSTTSGKVKGYERNGLVEYLGIPYAQPPVGELRFKRARPVTPWEGVFDAKEYGPEAVQTSEGKGIGSEDCLTINIQRPLEGENLPVFVWIHGGGYNGGGCNVPLYNGKEFAKEGIVFVAFQYRLNVFGFYDFTTYPGGENFESNCGLSDQILAIKWMHENIAAFGGDPNKVTIAGESAGGASVVNLLAAPAVKGMFQQAIAQSGLPNCVISHELARENIDLYLEGMGMTEEDVPKLLTMDPYEMLKGNDEYMSPRHQYKNPGMFLPGPIQDDLLPVRPIDAIRNGSANGVKLIIGCNAHEGTTFVHPENTGFPNSWAMIAEMFEKNGNIENFPDIIRYYHPNADAYLKEFDEQAGKFAAETTLSDAPVSKVGVPFIHFATDYAFQMPAVKVAEGQKRYTDDVWMYRYDLVTKSGEESGLKASHAFDLPAMFANRDFHFSKFIFDGEPEEVVDAIIHDMHGDWVRFTKTGEPNTDWPRYTGYDCEIRIYDRETRTERVDRTALMEAWGDMRFYED